MNELLRRFVERYGDIFPGTPDAGHFNVNQKIYIAENQAMKLKSGLQLRFNELRRSHVVRVSLVFKKANFGEDGLLQVYDLYNRVRQGTFSETTEKEYRIGWEFSNEDEEEAVEWMKDVAIDTLNLLPDDYYEIVPR